MLYFPHQLFTPEAARKLAKQLGADDDSWAYRVVDDPTGRGYSFIEVMDETGQVVGNL